jgi:hypothetical protein
MKTISNWKSRGFGGIEYSMERYRDGVCFRVMVLIDPLWPRSAVAHAVRKMRREMTEILAAIPAHAGTAGGVGVG